MTVTARPSRTTQPRRPHVTLTSTGLEAPACASASAPRGSVPYARVAGASGLGGSSGGGAAGACRSCAKPFCTRPPSSRPPSLASQVGNATRGDARMIPRERATIRSFTCHHNDARKRPRVQPGPSRRQQRNGLPRSRQPGFLHVPWPSSAAARQCPFIFTPRSLMTVSTRCSSTATTAAGASVRGV